MGKCESICSKEYCGWSFSNFSIPESLDMFVKIWIPVPHPRVSDSVHLEWDLRIFTTNKGLAAAAGVGPIL